MKTPPPKKPPNYLTRSDGPRLAYIKSDGDGEGAKPPGIVFLGGFRSDMSGTKAEYLDAWADERGRAFLRFDYGGHGASGGEFSDGCIGDWADDAADAVEALTAGPQILVGSSMGGWIALLLAKRMPERVAGIVGIAAAPDFTEDGIWADLSEAQRRTLMECGRIDLAFGGTDDPYPVTRRLIEDGRRNLLLRTPLELEIPIRLLQGTEDADVTPETALRLFNHIGSPDARLTLVKGAGHRFSGPRELALLGKTLHGLAQRV